jgi:hypothetical protein
VLGSAPDGYWGATPPKPAAPPLPEFFSTGKGIFFYAGEKMLQDQSLKYLRPNWLHALERSKVVISNLIVVGDIL